MTPTHSDDHGFLSPTMLLALVLLGAVMLLHGLVTRLRRRAS